MARCSRCPSKAVITSAIVYVCMPMVSLSDGVGQFNLRRKMAPWEPMSVDLPPGLSNRNKDDGRPTSDPSSVECTVHYAVGHAEKDGDLPQEILHCLLDEPDENGSLLYEIQGLESHEFAHIRDVVSHGNFPHVFEFPSVTKSRGAKPASIAHMPNGEETVVEEPTSPTIHVGKKDDFKFQAIEKSSKRRKNYNEAMGAEIPEGEENDTRRQRSLSKHQGISTILAVRTKALDGETSHSPNQCRARTFGGIDDDEFLDDLNVKSQIDACSYGKLNFVPPEDDAAYPAVQGGVVTVVLNKSVVGVSHGTVLDWLLVETPKVAGDLGRYDHVMFFMPDGVVFGGAAAFGYSPGKYTWYMDGYSLATGIQMHELGHNLGLGHSGEDGATYGDSSCYMGYGGFDVKMCYNAAKSWYLNWYSELKQEYDVLKDSARVYKIVGLADYDEALTASASDTSYAVVLKINTYESDNLFLTYNRREKMNEGTKEFEDKLTIVLSDGPSQSWAMAGLNPGQKYTTPVIPGSGIMLEIIVCERVFGYPDHMVVSVGKYGEEEQLCTPQSPIPSWETYSGKLTDGLIGYYNFDADFNDFSGFKHHGVAFGGPSLIADGMFGSALSFDGVDDFIELPSSTSLEFGTGDFTLTFWYRVDGDQSGSPAILGNKDWNSGMNPGWVVSSNYGPGSNGDDLAINLADGISRSDASNAMDVDFGSWHFVAVRVKRGDKMSLLRSIGGSYDIQEDDISSLSGSINSGLPIRIGTSHGYLEFTKMDLDDLGVWNRALSSEEVDAIYFAGRMYSKNLLEAFDPPPLPPIEDMPSTIIAKYEFENTLLDTSGNNLHGIFERGEGFSFQGTPDGLHLNLANADSLTKTYVSLPESGLLDFGSAADFTISFWQRTSDDSANDPSIISNKNWQSGINPGWTIGIGDDGRLEFNVGDGSNRCDFDGPSGAMTDGEWHHVSFSLTRGPVGVMTIFMDGTQLSKKTCALNTVSSGYSIKIGTDGTGGSSYPAFFDGDVDKVFIFGSALSHANVFLLFAEGRGMEGTLPPTKPPTTQPTMQPTTRPPTFSPTKKPTACPAAMPQECGCDEVQQSDYRGNISVTISGVQCQPWASQTPHSHTRTPENYPNSGLESNYCRNPDGEPSTWCYTMGSTRWDYCDVPVCSSAPPTKFPTPSPENDNSPTLEPSKQPTKSPLLDPAPTLHPTPASVPNTKPPTNEPTRAPMSQLSFSPSWLPSSSPTLSPTSNPTIAPTAKPTLFPTGKPTAKPTSSPSSPPSLSPTSMPTAKPTQPPSNAPTKQPTVPPSSHPTSSPTKKPTRAPTIKPTVAPSTKPTAKPVTTPPPTNQPTSDPACPGAMPQECGCSEVQQSDYRGNISVTISGVQCQPWAAQTPHAHTRTPENYPDSGLESNYCRNPDGEPRAWCYTVGSTRWEYCDVPSCRPCLGANSEICGCQEVMQSDYRGTIATTVDGEECQPWSSQTPHTHTRTPENYPLSGLDSNYCRNPDGEEKAWCYTTSSVRWNWCNVPNCIEQA